MEEQPKVGPTVLGKLVLFLFVLACIAGAAYYFRDLLAPGGRGGGKQVNLDDFKKVEAPDTKGITTVNEYKYVPGEKLPPVKGVSAYKWDPAQKVVNFPINVWIGWLPIVAANGGFAPNADSIFAKKYGFKVNLKLIDDPVVGARRLRRRREPRAVGHPRHDGALRPRPHEGLAQRPAHLPAGRLVLRRRRHRRARRRSRSVADLKGKTIVYAQNSPSQYFINNLLLNAGVQPSSVKHKFTATAFEAAAAFVADKSIDACVSWAPDIYNIPEKVKGTRILTTTAEANKLIADVWAARADFAKDHPDVVKGLVAGHLRGHGPPQGRRPSARRPTSGWPRATGCRPTRCARWRTTRTPRTSRENKAFFLNANDPANFERTWKNVTFVYRELGLIDTPVRFDEVMDFSVIQDLDKAGTFAAPEGREPRHLRADQLQEDVGRVADPHPDDPHQLLPELGERLRAAARRERARRSRTRSTTRASPPRSRRWPGSSGQYERAVVAVVGHTDSSMKGKGTRFEDVKQLSTDRAEAVKQALVKKYNFDPNKFTVEGKGWDEPANPDDPMNQALNRRVEISVYPPEAK